MATRFDASGDGLARTTDLLDYNSVYTWMAWIYLVSDLNAVSVFWGFNDGTTGNLDSVRTAADGTTLRLAVANTTTTNVDGTNLSTGVWYHIAVVRESATSAKVYLNGVLNITNTKDITARAALTRMEHGRNNPGGLRSDSRVAAIKGWSTNLSVAEIQNEIYTILPKRIANLYGFWPCFPGATERLRDYSVNARNWTAAGTLSDEEGPPIPWGLSAPAQAKPATPVVVAGWGLLLSDKRNRLIL